MIRTRVRNISFILIGCISTHLDWVRTRVRNVSFLFVGCVSICLDRLQRSRLRVERFMAVRAGKTPRVMAIACWDFPIYSQTFVYQELTQLIRGGFEVCFLYCQLNLKSNLPAQFTPLWRARRRFRAHPFVCNRAVAYFKKRMPEKIEQLTRMLCLASGMSHDDLYDSNHFRHALAFARMVEAYQPDYLHSYFFYDGTFFTWVASYLLDIPRGVSCYADHMLKDYPLKLVPLNLEQCQVVIATSERIKCELMGIAPQVPSERIVVKPNAINTAQFPVVNCTEPASGQPYRLTCVSRIEPKKGLIYLVEAVQILRAWDFNVVLHLIGGIDDNESSREYASVLNKRIEELRLGEFVHLEGRRSESDIKRFFERSHLFVAPFVETESGDKDGIPTSVLEAMASGLPVVATDAGSICEVIDDGQDGRLVPQRDANALASAIRALINNPARREQFGENAGAKIRAKFDVKVCEPLFHNRLLEILAADPRLNFE
jgi:colanic acid/amylovoran biosynthesis glycosyltransferase